MPPHKQSILSRLLHYYTKNIISAPIVVTTYFFKKFLILFLFLTVKMRFLKNFENFKNALKKPIYQRFTALFEPEFKDLIRDVRILLWLMLRPNRK